MSEQTTTAPIPDWQRPGARCTMSIEPAVMIRSPAFDWDHEVQVALPASYGAMPDKWYPVLWLTDGSLLLHLTVGLLNTLVIGGLAPEMIVVSVGCPSEAGAAEFGRRRQTDFAPPGRNILFDGPGGDYLRKLGVPEKDGPRQQADDFLAFLVDDLRPKLTQSYRMSADHGLLGHSGGGMFASYALFAKPGAFRRYIIGSPSSNATDRAAFRLEAGYAAANADLEADVFFGAGELEIGKLSLAAWGIVSAPVLMAETLLLRQYPSLKVTTRIFPGKNHSSVIVDIIAEGVRAVWADLLESANAPSA